MLIRIIGIGSPFGDDAVGMEAAAALMAAPPRECEVIAADRPGVGLIELLDGVGAAILIDAVRSGAAPGTLHEWSFPDLEQFAGRFVASHELGVAAALRIARSLGRAPACGKVLGIEIAPAPSRIPGPLSAAARQAVSAAVARVECWVEALRAGWRPMPQG